jgi:DNA replication protein DnaC
VSEVVARRLARGIDREGFGNARDVRTCWNETVAAALIREKASGHKPYPRMLEVVDVIGPPPSRENIPALDEALRELGGYTGLGKVKASIDRLVQTAADNYDRELAGEPPEPMPLNRIFIGNPGTGKTEVAKIYGRVLKALRLVSKGDCVVKGAGDFIGDVVGKTKTNTTAILASCAGKVLIIDEAYMLDDGGYGPEALDVIVEKVHNKPGEDIALVMLGYEDDIMKMLRDRNKGLKRRLNASDPFRFEDFSNVELGEIFLNYCDKEGWNVSTEVRMAAVEELAKGRNRAEPFGNAGDLKSMLLEGSQRGRERMRKAGAGATDELTLLLIDLVPTSDEPVGDPFEGLIGMEAVAKKVKRFSSTVKRNARNGKDLLHNLELNFCFVGAPGTGKTTVAQRMGRVFSKLGLPIEAEVVECKKDDFVTGFQSQAAQKTRETFRRAIGKVLFIDEAYQLNPDPPNFCEKDITDTICMMLTEDEFKGKMVVILAGYVDPIHALLKSNPGLGRRFTNEIAFPDWGVPEALQMLRVKLGKEDMVLHPDAKAQLEALVGQLVQAPDWSSGGDIDTWCTRICQENAVRVDEEEEEEEEDGAAASGGAAAAVDTRVLLCDLETSLTGLVKQKEERAKGGGGVQQQQQMQQQQQQQMQQMQQQRQKEEQQQEEQKKEQQEEQKEAQEEEQEPDAAELARRQQDADFKESEEGQAKLAVLQAAVAAKQQLGKQLKTEAAAAKAALEAAIAAAVEEAERLRIEEERLQREEEARIKAAAAVERARLEAEAEARRRAAEAARLAAEVRQRELEEQARQRAAEAERRQQAQETARRKEQEVQQKLRRIGRCVAGYEWVKIPGGYRCWAGGHTVSDAEIEA